MHLVILALGLGLVVFYAEHELPMQVQAQLAGSPDRIFPHFIINEIPLGLSGLFIAAIFAAAISTLDSALAESSDLSVTHIYAQRRRIQDSFQKGTVLTQGGLGPDMVLDGVPKGRVSGLEF